MKPIRHSLRSNQLAVIAAALSAVSHAVAQNSPSSSEVPESPANPNPAVEAVTNETTPVDSVRVQPTFAPASETGGSDVAPVAVGSEITLPRAEKPKKKGKKWKRKPQTELDALDEIALGDPWGDTRGELQIAGLSFRFLAQAHYEQTFGVRSIGADPNYRVVEEALARADDGWDLNRLFFRIMAEPSRFLALKIVTDFSEFRHNNPTRAIKQANVELRPVPKHIHIVAGVLKVPFDILELDPVSKFEFGSFGQTNEMLNYLAFAGRDIGAEIVISPISKPRYFNVIAGAFRGHATSENASFIGALGARAESEPIKGCRVGVGWVGHPQRTTYLASFNTSDKDLLANPADPNQLRAAVWDEGNAFGADLTFDRSGVMLRSEGMLGSRVDFYTRYGAQRWAALWGIAAYTIRVTGSVKLQPALRCEFLDTDLEHKGGLRRQYSFALSTYFNSSIRLMFDISHTDVQAESAIVEQPSPLRENPYLDLSNTRFSGQLQVVL